MILPLELKELIPVHYGEVQFCKGLYTLKGSEIVASIHCE